MIEIPSLRPETRYGVPLADQFLFNREYIVGYSYLFRQPRFAMEVIDPKNRAVEVARTDSFRPDLRVPEKFRADLDDFTGTGFDRGHLISSADRRATGIKNSETFLLTNMSPQNPSFNRGIWGRLEAEVRELAKTFVEVYVICGPLFDVDETITVIGEGEVRIPVAHSFFKSVLAERERGRMELFSFIFPNEGSSAPTSDFLTTTRAIEVRAGLSLWDRLRGLDIEAMKAEQARRWPPT